jgi:hypothetical protein
MVCCCRLLGKGGRKVSDIMADDEDGSDEVDPIAIIGGVGGSGATYTAGESDPRTIVVVMPYAAAAEGGLDLVNLPHPRSGQMARYALSRRCRPTHHDHHDDGVLYELQRCHRPTGSWLLGAPDNRVVEDGALFLATPIDATFLALPSLLLETAMTAEEEGKAGGRDRLFHSREDAITRGTGGEAMRAVLGVGSLVAGLAAVCETRTVDGDTFYRLSQDKLMAWLRGKVDALRKLVVDDPRVRGLAASGSCCAAYKKASEVAVTPEGVTRAALGLLSEYVPRTVLARLAKELLGVDTFEPAKAAHLVAPSKGVKRDRAEFSSFSRAAAAVTGSPGTPMAKRQKPEGEPERKRGPTEASRQEARRKRNEVAAKGTAKLSRFFAPMPPTTPSKDTTDGDTHK